MLHCMSGMVHYFATSFILLSLLNTISLDGAWMSLSPFYKLFRSLSYPPLYSILPILSGISYFFERLLVTSKETNKRNTNL